MAIDVFNSENNIQQNKYTFFFSDVKLALQHLLIISKWLRIMITNNILRYTHLFFKSRKTVNLVYNLILFGYTYEIVYGLFENK